MLSGILNLILLSISLSMDAFSVSIVNGIAYKDKNKKKLIVSTITFGVFQALFPLVGYLIGLTFIKYIENYDHWLAFALLLVLGLKMIVEAIKELHDKKENNQLIEEPKPLTYKTILVQGIATAIDAFAVGITLETSITPINVYLGIVVIGVITCFICLIGVFLGNYVSKLLKGKLEIAEIISGIILILIGIKMILNHLGYINF